MLEVEDRQSADAARIRGDIVHEIAAVPTASSSTTCPVSSSLTPQDEEDIGGFTKLLA
jgi:hypothetical protein